VAGRGGLDGQANLLQACSLSSLEMLLTASRNNVINANSELFLVYGFCSFYSRELYFSFLGAFEKLRKASVSFVVSVRQSVRMEQLSCHWTDFREVWYLIIFRKSVEKIQVLLQSDKNNGYFT
jgi:hypothetical protein